MPLPIIQVGTLLLGSSGVVLCLLLILAGGFGIGMWFSRKRQKALVLRTEFAESEITKMFKLITDDIDELSRSLKTSSGADDDYAFERLRSTVKKMELYLKQEVGNIKK